MSQSSYPSYPGPSADERSAGEAELRREAQAAVETRRELGPTYDDAIAAGLADKVEQLVAYRTAELRSQSSREESLSADERLGRNQRFALGIISLGVGIPITGIAATQVDPGLLGVVAAWAGIVGVNLVVNRGNRRRS